MAKTKAASSKGTQISTVLIYLLLLGTLATYVLPLQSVTLPAIGKKSWSVQDVIKTIPQSASTKSQKEKTGGLDLKIDFDFMDFVKEIAPKGENKEQVKISPEFIFGALMPIALVLSYVFVILSLLVAASKKGAGLIGFTLGAAISAVYVLVGTFYLSQAAQRAFQSSMAKIEGSPFAAITKNFVQEVSIQPEYGLYTLVALTALTAAVGFYRRNQA